jgi:hypothetical protein
LGQTAGARDKIGYGKNRIPEVVPSHPMKKGFFLGSLYEFQ